jgi:uncharacterized protein involved in type VI secretion and phage assembly
VLALEADPEGQHRVQVTVPGAGIERVWARLLQFHASSSFGAFFVPEAGDEVLLGWFNNDPGFPVVLGSLYSSKNMPPFALEAANRTKAIVIEDQNGNKVELNSNGITLDSPKDIRLTAKGAITLEAVNAVTIKSQADVRAEGLNVNCTAQVGFVAKGSATAELSASGQTTVTGAIVMIN